MNLTLVRTEFREDGIFGSISDESGNIICVTLEHAYEEDGNFIAKVRAGEYECSRHAPNRLPYETFELQNVPPFQSHPVIGILLHIGNFNRDSDGCILLGRSLGDAGNGEQMVTSSSPTFKQFMALQSDVNSFTLTIKEQK